MCSAGPLPTEDRSHRPRGPPEIRAPESAQDNERDEPGSRSHHPGVARGGERGGETMRWRAVEPRQGGANSAVGHERRDEKRREEEEGEFRAAGCWKGTEATAEEPQLLHDPGSPGERIRAPLQGRIARRYFPFFLSKAGPFLAASS